MSESRIQRINEKLKKIQSAINIRDIKSYPPAKEILEKNENFKDLKGYFVELSVADCEVYVPNASKFPDREGKYYDEQKNERHYAPLLTLKEWRNAYPASNRPDLLINANWFNLRASPYGPYLNLRKDPRTYLAGLSISQGKLVSSHKEQDRGERLSAIFFNANKKKATISFEFFIEDYIKNIKNKVEAEGVNAVAGFVILYEGCRIDTPQFNNNHDTPIPRTGIGIKDQGKTIVVIVMHNPTREYGVTAREFAKLFKSFGCRDAINLDNSGSVELHYRGNTVFGKPITIQTQTCDKIDDDKPDSERPKPNFIGFRNVKKPTLFYNEAPDKEIKQEPVSRRLSRSQ